MPPLMLGQIEHLLNDLDGSVCFTCQRTLDGHYAVMAQVRDEPAGTMTMLDIPFAELQSEAGVRQVGAEILALMPPA